MFSLGLAVTWLISLDLAQRPPAAISSLNLEIAWDAGTGLSLVWALGPAQTTERPGESIRDLRSRRKELPRNKRDELLSNGFLGSQMLNSLFQKRIQEAADISLYSSSGFLVINKKDEARKKKEK